MQELKQSELKCVFGGFTMSIHIMPKQLCSCLTSTIVLAELLTLMSIMWRYYVKEKYCKPQKAPTLFDPYGNPIFRYDKDGNLMPIEYKFNF